MKHSSLLYITVINILLLITGCHQAPDESFGFANSKSAETAAFAAEEAQEQAKSYQQRAEHEHTEQTSPQRKLIKEGWLSFETNDLNKSYQQVTNTINSLGGYVSSDQQDKSSYRTNYSITARVPASLFDSLIATISQGVENFDSKNINIKDVTEEFLDINARLKNKKELELRYLSLLKETKNISEILEIEQALTQIRSDIESVEGRLKYLSNRISLSTLHITFYKTNQHQEQSTSFTEHFLDGFINGWHNLIWFFIGVVNLWPFLLFIPISIFLWKRWKARKAKK